MQRWRDFGVHGPQWDVSIKVLTSKALGLCGRAGRKNIESEVMVDLKETVPSRHNRADAHTNSQRL